MAPSKAAEPTAPFAKDEKILCFHGPVLYEAKILDLRHVNSAWQFKIHYKGWKNTVSEFFDNILYRAGAQVRAARHVTIGRGIVPSKVSRLELEVDCSAVHRSLADLAPLKSPLFDGYLPLLNPIHRNATQTPYLEVGKDPQGKEAKEGIEASY